MDESSVMQLCQTVTLSAAQQQQYDWSILEQAGHVSDIPLTLRNDPHAGVLECFSTHPTWDGSVSIWPHF